MNETLIYTRCHELQKKDHAIKFYSLIN